MAAPEGESVIMEINHVWVGDMQGVNSGLCDCNFGGEIISSDCACGDFHSWCANCWKVEEREE